MNKHTKDDGSGFVESYSAAWPPSLK